MCGRKHDKKKCELLWVDVNFKRTKNCFFLTRKSVFLYSVNSLFLSLHNISFVKSVPLLSFQHLFYRNTISFSVIFFLCRNFTFSFTWTCTCFCCFCNSFVSTRFASVVFFFHSPTFFPFSNLKNCNRKYERNWLLFFFLFRAGVCHSAMLLLRSGNYQTIFALWNMGTWSIRFV